MSTRQSCYGTEGHTSRQVPMLVSPHDPTPFPAKTEEDDGARNLRLFGRMDVRMFNCGGPCVGDDIIDTAFGVGK